MQAPRSQQIHDRPRNSNRQRFPRPPRSAGSTSVPSKSEVVHGAAVSIVLKADQPTGREVQGIVADVLTSGDHPRGIKVRLTDGRVGRVQRMAASNFNATSRSTSTSTSSPTVNPVARVNGAGATGNVERTTSSGASGEQINGLDVVSNAAAAHGPGQRLKYRDIRLDEDGEKPQETADLFDYIKIAKPKKKGKGPKSAPDLASIDQGAEVGDGQADKVNDTEEGIGKMRLGEGKTASCPVCGTFEGDEAAVAHHVEGHFT